MNVVSQYECWTFNDNWYLIEMLLNVPASEINWDEFVVPERNTDKCNWQCPYMEQYLNEDGTERICGTYKLPYDDTETCRVTFYLYKGTGKILQTPYGTFELNDSQEAPDRLKSILAFEED